MTFESTKAKIYAQGIIQDDGTYELRSANGTAGLPEGDYRISVRPRPTGGGEGEGIPRRHLIEPRFYSSETSGLTATVRAGSNDIPVKIKKVP